MVSSSFSAKVSAGVRPLGSYLIEAGLLTSAQVDVALNDQNIVEDMRFGEVLVARGWIKQQTLDYLIHKIIEPEQESARRNDLYAALLEQAPLPPTPLRSPLTQTGDPRLSSPPMDNEQSYWAAPKVQETLNDRKPLPSVPGDDSGVNWVG
jgi:hypothetical protein